MDAKLTNLQQLCDSFMSIWTRMSERLVESVPQIFKAALKGERVHPGTCEEKLIKRSVSVCMSLFVFVLLIHLIDPDLDNMTFGS